jgi:hypothetical protein
MEKRLHKAGDSSRAPRSLATARRRAGIPVKRFFSRFRSLSDVPAADLEFLSEHIRRVLDAGPESRNAALHAVVRREIRNRESALND